MRKTCLALALCLTPMAVPAADADTEALLDELRQLSEKARTQRAADRWLQRDLDDLIARYDWPWRKELISDDFADGDYQNNPSWQVLSGRFWVSRGRGLRSRAESTATTPTNGGTRDTAPSVEEAVLGALLEQAFGGGQRESRRESHPTQPVPGEPNTIRLDSLISNAYAVDTEFSLETPDGPGRVALALLQGTSGQFGYRLRLQSGRDGFVELERIRRGRAAIVERTQLKEETGDGARHRLAWRQAPDGQVTIEVDGQAVINVRDKAFRDGYQQLLLNHWSGDLTLHNIRVSGTN